MRIIGCGGIVQVNGHDSHMIDSRVVLCKIVCMDGVSWLSKL